MGINILKPEKEGYEIKHIFENWRVAYLQYADRFDNITYMERHLQTDEIFILVEGSASLITDDKTIKMDKNIMYNVTQGTWHNIKVSHDALVVIIENANTSKDNTEYKAY